MDKHVKIFYHIYISVDLAHHEIFRGKVVKVYISVDLAHHVIFRGKVGKVKTSNYHYIIISATNLYVTAFNCRPKPKICRLKPVICRPAQEHSRHEPVMECRPEQPCVVTDIPKRDHTHLLFLNAILDIFLILFTNSKHH